MARNASDGPGTIRRNLVLPSRFWVLWCGQVVTLLGNSVLDFVFVIHAWESGEQATKVVLLILFAMLPQMLLSPTAGALVDRCRKRTALRLADLAGLIAVSGLTAVYFSGQLRLWEIYVAVALGGAATAFQYPALSSAVPLLVPERQYQRANGLLSAASSIASVCGPVLAGVLIATAGLGLILWVDLASFVFALVSVQFVRLREQPRAPATTPRTRRGLTADSAEGLRYLFARPSLRGLTLVFFMVNLVTVFGMAVLQPMILARTGGDASKLAVVMSCMGAGGVAGGLLTGAWGGPRNRIRGMTLGVIGLCLSALVGMAVARSVAGWCVAIFIGALLLPMINSAEQSIVQTKVPLDIQGRVFGASLFATSISAPLALAVAGPLADHVFEPHGAPGGVVRLFEPLLGYGPGSGMAAMLLIAGACGIATAVIGMASRPVRDIDLLIPDLDTGADASSRPLEEPAH
jgi:MFS transporter, DHA3 family, macrolide efflux protein